DANEMLDELDDVRLDRVSRSSGTSGARKRSSRPAPRRRPRRQPTTSRTPLFVGVGAGALAVVATLIWALGFGGDGHADARLISEIPREHRSEEQQQYVALLEDARDHLRSGDDVKAMAAADKAVRLPLADAEALLVRAKVYERQGDLDTALLDYQEAEKQLPGYAPAVAGIGWLLFERGEHQAADQRFRAAMTSDPYCGAAFAGAAAVLLHGGASKQALALLDQQNDDVAQDPRVLVWRGEALLQEGRTDDALEVFRQAKRGDSSLWRAYLGLARSYERKDDLAAAERECTAGLALAGQAGQLRQLHAELLVALDRHRDALEALGELRRKDGDAYVIEGLAQQGLDKPLKAVAAWTRALEEDPSEPALVHLLLAMQHARDGDWKLCAEQAEAAARRDGRLARAAFYRGIAAFRLEDFDAAGEALARAVELDGSDLTARYTLGVVYMDYLERPADALAQFEAYLAAGGDDPKVAGFVEKLSR
ncbi:MAG: tetratricopeptide repeat protein, partial [Planctomycetes bacterium]|nr:tetratricopeptide repeat protein [Planctomycetota bacterium]